jgi:hypothetical protein
MADIEDLRFILLHSSTQIHLPRGMNLDGADFER